MSDLRKQLIRLAHENPGEVRDALLPLMKEAGVVGPESRPAVIVTAHALASLLDDALFWLTDMAGSASRTRNMLGQLMKELRANESNADRRHVTQTMASVRRVVPFDL